MRTWLREIRHKKKLSQVQVAEASSITEAYYCMIEGGVRCPSVKSAKKIGKALDFEWTIFFDDTINETLN